MGGGNLFFQRDVKINVESEFFHGGMVKTQDANYFIKGMVIKH